MATVPFGDDRAIVGGFARFNDRSVMIIGHQKGKTLKERMQRNFGMPNPEGYRKALRLMKMAEKFGRPIMTFIDTPGAYPGIGAEERGQAEAIARNLFVMSRLDRPDHFRRHRRRRQRRRPGSRRVRPRADVGTFGLFGHFTGRLRRHSLGQPGKGAGCRRRIENDGAGSA